MPNKIKNFLLRACWNILHTKDNLCKRKCVPDDCCDICGLMQENVEHCVLECEQTAGVWFATCFGIKICPSEISSYDRWLLKTFSSLDSV